MISPSWHDAPWHETLDWIPTSRQLRQFEQLYTQVLEGNQQQNLTRITQPSEFWEKHLWDSLQGLQLLGSLSELPLTLRGIDLGTGAGFPGLPVAIACPQWSLTLNDATQRKVAFVNSTVLTLGLPHISSRAARIESLAHEPTQRHQYDLALIRAVAPVTVCAEYALPFLKRGGRAILYRGQWTAAEADDLTVAVSQLGGQIADIKPYQTPLSQSIRHGVILLKTDPTPPRFPRGVGIPQKRPLGTSP